jgi:hypothetical protein
MSLFVSLCFQGNHIGGIMVSILASSAIDYGFEPRSDQTKDNEIWQQSMDGYVTPLGHISLIPSQTVFALSP